MGNNDRTVAGAAVWLSTLTGTVAGDKESVEHHISGGGGGGYISQGSGYIGSTHISTQIKRRQDFWIVPRSGQECRITGYNMDIPLREGQRMSAVWGGPRGTSNGPFMMLHNHAINRDIDLMSGAAMMRALGVRDPALFAFIGAFLVMLALFRIKVMLFGVHISTHSDQDTWMAIALCVIVSASVGGYFRRRKIQQVYYGVRAALHAEVKGAR